MISIDDKVKRLDERGLSLKHVTESKTADDPESAILDVLNNGFE